MNTLYHKFLVVFAIAILMGGVYVYFSNDLKANADATSDIVSSSSGNSPTDSISSTDEQISQDTAFLATLISLTKIRIDTSLFTSSSFNALNDNTVVLEPSPSGRPNPFAPITSAVSDNSEPVSIVTTNLASGITNKSAVLNGALGSDISGVTSTYFEYGTTDTFGKSTPPVKQSLIGTFVTSISGLTSGTTYYFHAVAKIGGTTHFGETISFDTN